MISRASIQNKVFEYTRKVERITIPSYYKAVLVGQNRKPYWNCRHKHFNRIEAFDCLLETYPKLFGTETEHIKEMVHQYPIEAY